MKYLYNLGLAFHEVAQHYADRPAICLPDGTEVLYAELERKSNQVARWLIGQGVKGGDVIAIFNEKSPQALATMLAALKVGAAYTNLDLNSPNARLDKMLKQCQPKLLLYDQPERPKGLHFEGFPYACLQDPAICEAWEEQEVTPITESRAVHGEMPAYIMFTSGSTGFPKGVVISHQNVLNLISWAQEVYEITPEDRLSNVNPIYFDNSVFDFYSALFSGACLLPIPVAITRDGKKLIETLEQERCTFWFSVPSLLVYLLTTRVLEKGRLPDVRCFSFGGEGFPKPKLKQLFDLFHTQAKLYNVYGPTECTCICSSYLITEADFKDMKELAPLGRLAPNFGFAILPIESENPKRGELCLTGPQVGKGYFRDTERTQKSFGADPNISGVKLPMYRTGDLVEQREDGLLYFLGRVDHQIKHMGYRIELEEIEAALNTLPEVREAAAIYQSLGNGMGRIHAFVAGQIDKDSIRDGLKKQLPDYMMPTRFHRFEMLPKNANGKIDRVTLKEKL